jgi:WD40 repeat protein/serine/threonine protein kinase/Flp pilus assembly protein TadD
MGGCPTPEQLESFLSGSLAGAEGEAICGHVEGCPRCQGMMENLVSRGPVAPVLRAPDPVPNEQFLDRLKADPPLSGWSAPNWDIPTRVSAAPSPAGRELSELLQLPGYEILEELGRGGMGVVYKARQVGLNRLTAVKMVLAGSQAELDARVRFRAEAEAVAALHHPNIVQVYEVGEHRGSPFFSMEYVPGGTLRNRLRGGPAPPRESAALVATLARAVQYAHDRGIVHRDLKPANILLQRSEVRGPRSEGEKARSPSDLGPLTSDLCPKIADFGLAKRLDDAMLTQTQTGRVMGTPSYMAPEQAGWKGNRAGPPVDVYALGAILYECLTGRPPFLGESFESTINLVLTQDPVPPRRLRPEVPRDLETVCLKCLEKDPHRRYASAELLADDLDRFLAGKPVLARPVGTIGRGWRWCRRNPALAALWGGFVAALVLGLVGVSWKWREAEAARKKVAAAEQRTREERDQANTARDESRRLTAGMLLDKGIDRAEKGDVAAGLFWMLEALNAAPEDDRGLRRAARLNLAAWLPLTHGLRLAMAGDYWCVAIAPDGRRFATCSNSSDVQLWDTATGRPVGSPTRLAGPQTGVATAAPGAVVFAPDGTLFVGCAGPRAQRFDAQTGRPVGDPLPHPEYVHAAAFSPDGTRLATACEDGVVRLWDAATGKPLGEPFRDTATHPICLAFSPDGATLAVGTCRSYENPRSLALLSRGGRDLYGEPAAAHLVDPATGRRRGGPLLHPMAVNQVAFSGDGRRLLTASSDSTARVWDVATGRLAGPRMPHVGQVRAAAFTPDGATIATGDAVGQAGGVRWWDAATHRPVAGALPRHHSSVFGLAFTPDGRTLATAVAGGEVRLWRVARPLTRPHLTRPDGSAPAEAARPTYEAAFSPDGRTALAWTPSGHVARLWDAAGGWPRGVPVRHPWVIFTAVFSPDGTRAAVTSLDSPGAAGGSVSNCCEVIDAATGRRLFTLPHPNWVSALAFSPDGKVLATGSFDRHVHLWDAATGARVDTAWRQQDIVHELAFSPDGRTLAVSHYGDDRGALGTTVWDVAARRPRGPELPFNGVHFTPDGRLLMSTWVNEPVRLWDAATCRPASPPIAPANPTEPRVVFSPVGRAVLTAGADGTARLWDVVSGQQVGAPMAHPHPVTARAFSPDGRFLGLGYADGTARLWDLETHKPVGPPLRHDRPVRAVAFTPDGRSLLTAAADGVPRTRPVPEPLAEADPGRVRLRLEVRTGLAMADEGVAELPPQEWQERRQRLAELEGTAEGAYAGDADDRTWHDARARDAEAGGEHVTALWHLDRLVAVDPGDWRLRARRARAHSDAGRLADAGDEYAEALRLGRPEELLTWYGHRTIECELAGRWDTALWYLNRTAAETPDAWGLYAARAAVHDKLGRAAERDADLDRAVRLAADGSFLLRFAADYARRGRWDRAVDCYARVGMGEPVGSGHHLRHALGRLMTSDPAGYGRLCRELLAAAGPAPDFASAYMVVRVCVLRPAEAVDYAAVVRLAERMMEGTDGVHRRQVAALSGLGAALCRAGRYREAIDRFNEVFTLRGDGGAPQDWMFLALAHHRIGNADEARKLLAKVTAYTPVDGTLDWQVLEVETLRREAAAAIRP